MKKIEHLKRNKKERLQPSNMEQEYFFSTCLFLLKWMCIMMLLNEMQMGFKNLVGVSRNCKGLGNEFHDWLEDFMIDSVSWSMDFTIGGVSRALGH